MNVLSRTWMCFVVALPLLFAMPGNIQGQATGMIRGRVVGAADGQALPGAQVELVGTQRGTLSGNDGGFLIPGVPVGRQEVRVTYLGFGSVTRDAVVVAGEAVVLDFELGLVVLDLEEIVVTGVAGEATRKTLAFTVDRLTQAAVPVQATDAGSMITGKVAGATVVSSSGRPGSSPTILLRGPTSINASGRDQEPLYIVDGVILSSSVVDIDASDIESIEIVKGAAAASLYGSRAAAGVIQITTARGKNVAQDNVRYTMRTEYGGNQLPGRFNLTDRHQFAMSSGQFLQQDGTPCDWLNCKSVRLAGQRALTGEAASAWNTIQQEEWPGKTYDHVDRFFQGGNFMSNYIGVAGRSGGTNFNVTYNRQDDKGILPYADGAVRNNFRVNVDQSIRSNLTLSATALYSRTRASSNDGNIFQLTRMPAGVDLMAPDPTIPNALIIKPDPFNDNVNPLYTMSTTDNWYVRGRYLGSMDARWTIRDWFNLQGTIAYDRLDYNSQNFRDKPIYTATFVRSEGSLGQTASRTEGMNAGLTATFTRRFNDLATTTLLRYSVESEDYYTTSTSGSQFTAQGVWTFSNIPDEEISASSSSNFTRADGVFLITSLIYKDRYILDGLVRNDGSSRFGPDQRRHWYYRGAGAYRISEEDWFNVPGINDMKLRYSVGTAGTTPSFSSQYETYSVSSGAITPVTLGNRNLKPEHSTEHEMGLDLLLLDRISLDLTYARSTVEDQILQVPALAYTGFSSQWRNAGTLESNTFEATLNATLFRTPNFSWNARLLFDRTKQEITKLDVPAYQTGTGDQGLTTNFYVREGEAIGSFYGFQFATQCAHLPEGVDCTQFQRNDDGFLVWVGDAGSWQNGWQTYTDGTGATKYWWGTAAPFTIRGQAITWGTPFQAEGIDRVTGDDDHLHAPGDHHAGLQRRLREHRHLARLHLLRPLQGHPGAERVQPAPPVGHLPELLGDHGPVGQARGAEEAGGVLRPPVRGVGAPTQLRLRGRCQLRQAPGALDPLPGRAQRPGPTPHVGQDGGDDLHAYGSQPLHLDQVRRLRSGRG